MSPEFKMVWSVVVSRKQSERINLGRYELLYRNSSIPIIVEGIDLKPLVVRPIVGDVPCSSVIRYYITK